MVYPFGATLLTKDLSSWDYQCPQRLLILLTLEERLHTLTLLSTLHLALILFPGNRSQSLCATFLTTKLELSGFNPHAVHTLQPSRRQYGFDFNCQAQIVLCKILAWDVSLRYTVFLVPAFKVSNETFFFFQRQYGFFTSLFMRFLCRKDTVLKKTLNYSRIKAACPKSQRMYCI